MDRKDQHLRLNTSDFSHNQVIPWVGWVVLSFVASSTAVFVSTSGWYAGLNKPAWNPPDWIFGPVWTLLYLMMGTASWLVWREGGWKAQRIPLIAFLLQWLFNALWTPLFFGAHQIGLAFIDIIVLWLTLAMTLTLFFRVSKPAGMLLIPYFSWVCFAAILNFTMLQLNP